MVRSFPDRRYRIPAAATSKWSEEKALAALGIQRVPFDDLEGNTKGYTKCGRKVAVSLIAALPVKTLFHEIGHVMLGHTEEGDLSDTERTPQDIREMEAEAVSLLCCESLGLPGAEYSRGYVQSWGQGQTFTERSAQRIFHAATGRTGSDKGGRVEPPSPEQPNRQR